MVITRNLVWTSLLVAAITASALGCATSSGSSKTIAAGDLPALAGRWTGFVLLPSGQNVNGTFDLMPTGEYVTNGGSFVARGKAEVRNGALMLTSTSITGGLSTGQRTSTATLSESPDGTLSLRGNGHSDAGPFSFDVSRKR